jgi:hypothetical protein
MASKKRDDGPGLFSVDSPRPAPVPVVITMPAKPLADPFPSRVPDGTEEVTVEPEGERFLVSLLRHDGTTRVHVYCSRRQLEMLLRRIPAALEVGR